MVDWKNLVIFEKLCIEMKWLALKIASLIYETVVRFRNLLFNLGWISSRSFDVPVICIGNITVGGTGKTPAVESIVSRYCLTRNVAVISRGYGRKTKGYRVVNVDDTYVTVGDEPLQIKRKFPQIPVIVCEKRVYGIERLLSEFPDTDLVIMDDGFQHRYVKPFINIIMVDATRPVDKDHMLPLGQLRDNITSLHRAHYFIVTKCPDDMQPLHTRLWKKNLISKASQLIYFTRQRQGDAVPVFADVTETLPRGSKVVTMSGIGNSDAFNKAMAKRYEVVENIDFDDHHIYRVNDLKMMIGALERHPEAYIITTEKDAVKLAHSSRFPAHLRNRLFYERVEITFNDGTVNDFFQNLDKDIDKFNDDKYVKG